MNLFHSPHTQIPASDTNRFDFSVHNGFLPYFLEVRFGRSVQSAFAMLA